jgi:hypothetical protein
VICSFQREGAAWVQGKGNRGKNPAVAMQMLRLCPSCPVALPALGVAWMQDLRRGGHGVEVAGLVHWKGNLDGAFEAIFALEGHIN